MQVLWMAGASTLSLVDDALVQYSPYTMHPGGSCDQQAALRERDIYKLDPTCGSGHVNLSLLLTYSADWRRKLNAASGRTPVYTVNAPQVLLYMCPHPAMCVIMHARLYRQCVTGTTLYVSSSCYICVRYAVVCVCARTQISSAADGYYSVAFDDDKSVCFITTDNQAVKWGRGLNNSVSA